MHKFTQHKKYIHKYKKRQISLSTCKGLKFLRRCEAHLTLDGTQCNVHHIQSLKQRWSARGLVISVITCVVLCRLCEADTVDAPVWRILTCF
ncbi:hypothetical protein EUGRSUZ_F03257 [Eucalyptus grandis]|uniref:Uncharacterized protein n=2 Tax=Eucalyptus grandis TaxID=71139 RepID=A0ACC3KLP2_EUCGR|nr:hypothetical protein EUGRSUZ_F03257 [Eucalyptus grandis]